MQDVVSFEVDEEVNQVWNQGMSDFQKFKMKNYKQEDEQ